MNKCELLSICDCKTAVCNVELPDESCYYYRYFKKLILNEYKNYDSTLGRIKAGFGLKSLEDIEENEND